QQGVLRTGACATGHCIADGAGRRRRRIRQGRQAVLLDRSARGRRERSACRLRRRRRETVDAFHAAALEAGGTDNGAPGVRELYHPSYYGACWLDPDGTNSEAVCQKPASLTSSALSSAARVAPPLPTGR